jgi:hypothetical protein
MTIRTELTLPDGRRFAVTRDRLGQITSLHRVLPTPHLVGGKYQAVFDNYRSISKKTEPPPDDRAAILGLGPGEVVAMISIALAAERLGLSRQRVALLAKLGRIPGARLVGGRVWFLPDPPHVTPGVMGRPRKR